ncbi:MAG: hypothetical protein GC136_01215 [Alphaproteobacteria bacterium]|nr:hypothetical protein [Alphaproteobacteria bacterium]
MINQAQFDAIKTVVVKAGSILREGWLNPQLIVYETKKDGSLVSNYDRKSEAIMLAELPAIIPDIPLIAEEEDAAGVKKEYSSLYCTIDPLDGTRSYLSEKRGLEAKRGFATLLAIVENGKTTAAVVYSPVHNILISAMHGVHKVEKVLPDGTLVPFTPPPRTDDKVLRVAFNRTATQDYAEENYFGKLREAGYTISYDKNPDQFTRLVQAALGELDFYFADGSAARSWDVAPFDLLLAAQGGKFWSETKLDDAYGTHHHFIAGRDRKLLDLILP